MDRFTRFKTLRALWARARALRAWLQGPQHHQARLRAQRWQQINIAERLVADGIVRGTGDPDAFVRPVPPVFQQPREQETQARRQGTDLWLQRAAAEQRHAQWQRRR